MISFNSRKEREDTHIYIDTSLHIYGPGERIYEWGYSFIVHTNRINMSLATDMKPYYVCSHYSAPSDAMLTSPLQKRSQASPQDSMSIFITLRP
jgi:hypothetical protein